MTDRPSIQKIESTADTFGIPHDWAMGRTKRYTAYRMSQIRSDITECRRSQKASKGLELGLLESRQARLEKEFDLYKRYLKYLNNPPKNADFITDTDIENARNYPIRELIEHSGKGNIKCLFGTHDDKNPSMQIFDDGAFCHRCGQQMNAVDYIMLRDGTDFKTAVRMLAR